jgi:hypothetical protein
VTTDAKIARVWRLARDSLKAAQEAYLEEFGRTINDPSINREIRKLFGYPRSYTQTVVPLPKEVVLALLLRAGGRSRGNQGKSLNARLAKAEMFEVVDQRWPEILAEAKQKGKRMRRGEAKRQAAKEAPRMHGQTAGLLPRNANEADYERAAMTLLDQMKPSKRKLKSVR